MDYVVTLVLLIMLQAVLGFDNLLYITLESKRAPLEQQKKVRVWGIGLAVVFRIVLLFFIVSLVKKFSDPFFHIELGSLVEPKNIHGPETEGLIHNIIDGGFNLHAIIVLIGGVFILYTAVKEIFHMLGSYSLEDHDTKPKSAKKIIAMIVVVNLIFSFDSILSAMALAKDPVTGEPNMVLMTIAIVIGGFLMIWLSDSVASFLEKNRMYEVLGLFILFVVGIMLLTEGAHLSHLHIGGNEITPMTKTTFYFVIAVLAFTDVVQGRYQKQLMAKKAATQARLEMSEKA